MKMMQKLLVTVGLFGVLGLAVITTVTINMDSNAVILADGDEYGNGG